MKRRALVTAILCGLGPACACEGEQVPASCRALPREDGGVTIACSDGTRHDVAAGEPGAPCVVTRGPGSAWTLRCPDGTSAVIADGAAGAGCWLERDGGSRELVCADGTRLALDDGRDGVTCDVHTTSTGMRLVTCPDGTAVALVPGEPGATCGVIDHGDGDRTIACEDGLRVTVAAGVPGTTCELEVTGPGTRTLTCPDGSSVTIVDGADGTGCVVRREPDAQVIECGGGASVRIVDGGDAQACAVSVLPDGFLEIDCPDGTRVVVRPGTGAPGTIEGTAAAYPEPGTAGVVVAIDGLALRTVTAADGSFRLDGVPAGVHLLTLELAGHEPTTVANVVVVGGSTELGPITLRQGWRLEAHEPTSVELSADGRWVAHDVPSDQGRRELVVRDLVARTSQPVGAFTGPENAWWAPYVRLPPVTAFDPTSTRLFASADHTTRRAGVLHDLATGASGLLDDDIAWSGFSIGGARVHYLRAPAPCGPAPHDVRGELVVRDAGSRAELLRVPDVDASYIAELEGSGALAFTQVDDTAEWRGSVGLWDPSIGLLTSHAGPCSPMEVEPAPGGAHVALRRNGAAGSSAELVIVDVATRSEALVGRMPPANWVWWSPDGSKLAFHAEAWAVEVYDVASAAATVVGEGWIRGWSPDASVLAGIVDRPTTRELWLWDVRSGVPSVVAEGALELPYDPFSPDSRYVIAGRGASPYGLSQAELLLLDRQLGTETVLSSAAQIGRSSRYFTPAGDVYFVEVTGGELDRLVLWNPATATRTVLTEGVARTRPIVWSDDGAVLLVAENPATIPGYPFPLSDFRLWELAGGRQIRLCGPCAARLSPDGSGVLVVDGVPGTAGEHRLSWFDVATWTALPLDRDVIRAEQADRSIVYWTERSPGDVDLWAVRLP